MSLFATVLLATVISRSPFSNTTQCAAPEIDLTKYCNDIYIEKLITPMGVPYVSLNKLTKFIRYYNYKTYPIKRLRSKSQRRKQRRQRIKNYKLYSYSPELDDMKSICEINYENLNINSIKFKYNHVVRLVQRQRETEIILSFISILAVLGLLLLMLSSCIPHKY